MSQNPHYIISLYFACIQSKINYCLLNWGNAPTTSLKSIKTSLNKAVRVICFKDNRYHANSLYKELNILPLEDCYKLKLAIFMWKITNSLITLLQNIKEYLTITTLDKQNKVP